MGRTTCLNLLSSKAVKKNKRKKVGNFDQMDKCCKKPTQAFFNSGLMEQPLSGLKVESSVVVFS